MVAVALHDGHDVREEVAPLFAIPEADRLREEDPFTAVWTTIAPTKVIARRSRFEVDLNRPREKAVYRTPADAWGLTVWHNPLPHDVLKRSLAIRAEFYDAVEQLLTRLVDQHGRVVIYELHTYNHHRLGPDAPFDDPQLNPQVNLGTAYNDPRWRPVLERFMRDLREHEFPGGKLDVRENIKFEGGYFAQWIGERFPNTVCNLCIEFKKFFMDEWTGVPDAVLLAAITTALESTLPGVLEELDQL
ncbi:MAG: N-formylglutamate amidohydrolase [Bythopirellula sp.]|nr:N-formylglutamate amidohydrolase [Bythopirellula sp.]